MQYYKHGVIILRNYLTFCREFADPVVAEATLEFLIINKKKLVTSFPNLLPQVYLSSAPPSVFKNVACNEIKKFNK